MNEQRRSNEGILSALNEALRGESSRLADVLSLLIEIEDRGLHLELAYSSIFTFCREHLHFSGDETYRRVTAAHLGRRFPQVLEALRTRRVLLTSVVMLKNLFTPANVDELLAAAEGKTVRQMEDLIARLAPRPDVKASIRQMPQPKAQTPQPAPRLLLVSTPQPVPPTATPHLATPPQPTTTKASPGLTTTTLTFSPSAATHSAVMSTSCAKSGHEDSPSSPSGDAPPVSSRATTPRTSPSIPLSRQFSPLSETRHKVQFTASSALREKLERAQSLMRHRNLDGDLAVVVERALDVLIATIEKQKFATTTRPAKRATRAEPSSAAATKAAAAAAATKAAAAAATTAAAADDETRSYMFDWSRPVTPAPPAIEPTRNQTVDDTMKRPSRRRREAIPAATKRALAERDERQCTFVSTTGKRCGSRDLIEVDHRHPHALGGTNDLANLRLLCRAHNAHEARRIFGADTIDNAITTRRSKPPR